MSAFRYNSRHKAVVGALIIITSAALFYLRDREKPQYGNGQTKQTGNQVDGRNHGLWTWYFPNGKRRMQGRFALGEREGVWITFSESGDTLTKAHYQNDRLNGEYMVYGSEDRPRQRMIYKNDRLIRTEEISR